MTDLIYNLFGGWMPHVVAESLSTLAFVWTLFAVIWIVGKVLQFVRRS